MKRYSFLLVCFAGLSIPVLSQTCTCLEPGIEKMQTDNNPVCRARAFEQMATNAADEDKNDSAEIYFEKALDAYKQSGCSDSIFLNLYKQRAQFYYVQGDFGKAQEYSFKLLEAAEDAKDPYEIAICYTMIAHMLNQTAQAEKGILYSRQAVALLKKIEQPLEQVDLLFKLSKRYLWHYQDTKTNSSLDSSELFSLQQLAIARKANKNSSIASAYSNLQGIAWERNDFRKALAFLDSSFSYISPDNFSTLATNYLDKANLLLELKEYAQSERMADSAMYFHKQFGSVAHIAGAYELLSRIAREKGDYKKAWENDQSARAITDSIRNVEKTKQVSELEKKYNQARNEKTIRELAQQKKIYLLLALSGLLLLLASVFFIRQQKFRNRQKVTAAQQRLNRARINPHFFFNALSSLQSQVLLGADTTILASDLAKFSHIMRETLESSYKDEVTVEDEIVFLENYLSLQKNRFPEKFTYKIETNCEDASELFIPSMIVQPFVENSIEHAFSGISYSGHISVQFCFETNELLIIVADNGKGLAAAANNNEQHTSRATQIIKDRLYLLNRKEKSRARFSIDNNENGPGVTVTIHLPARYKK